jgi:hypothetical protein
MSSVIRPAGPLPSRVYWVRRLLLLTILVVVLSLAWLIVGRVLGGADTPTADGSTSGGTPALQPGDTGAGGDGPQGTPGGNAAGQQQDGPAHDGHRGQSHHQHGDKAHQTKPPLRPPTDDCAPADVGMRVSVDDARPGLPTPVTLKLTSLGSPACRLAITPDSLMLRITSGEDVIWSSDDCPDDLLAKELVIRSHPATDYTFDWNGFRSTASCSAPGKVTKPGGYWAEAALIGAETHRGYFDIK